MQTCHFVGFSTAIQKTNPCGAVSTQNEIYFQVQGTFGVKGAVCRIEWPLAEFNIPKYVLIRVKSNESVFQLVAICILTARCHYIVHTAPLIYPLSF